MGHVHLPAGREVPSKHVEASLLEDLKYLPRTFSAVGIQTMHVDPFDDEGLAIHQDLSLPCGDLRNVGRTRRNASNHGRTLPLPVGLLQVFLRVG